MCLFLWITWPKLAIFEDTYIWTVCSSKRKSHAIEMNIWLYRQFEILQILYKKTQSQIEINKIKISKFRHNCAEILIWFDFEQIKKKSKNNFEMK